MNIDEKKQIAASLGRQNGIIFRKEIPDRVIVKEFKDGMVNVIVRYYTDVELAFTDAQLENQEETVRKWKEFERNNDPLLGIE